MTTAFPLLTILAFKNPKPKADPSKGAMSEISIKNSWKFSRKQRATQSTLSKTRLVFKKRLLKKARD